MVSTVISQPVDLGSESRLWPFFVEFACFPVHAWVFSLHSIFLLRSKDMLVRCIDQSKLTIGESKC